MYSFDSRIRYSETDNHETLTFQGLLNYFQDASTFQSESLGLGMDYMRKQQLVWVLCSWQIVVKRMPKLCDKVTIGTLPYEFKKFIAQRNFVMYAEDGSVLAVANSVWSLLSAQTGRPAIVPPEMVEGYQLEAPLEMEYAPRKITVPEGGEPRDYIVIKKHHLDSNQHVNNGQYVSIAMEYLPEDFAVCQMRAEYKKQAHLENVMYPRVYKERDMVWVSLEDETGSAYAVVEFSGK